MLALDLERRKIERTNANLTLRRVGEASRLSSLNARSRAAQQLRLYEALFVRARDPYTLAVSALVETAAKAEVLDPRALLTEAIAGRLGAVEAPLRDLLITAWRFGDVMQVLLGVFDRVYQLLHARGWVSPAAKIVSEALGAATLSGVREACQHLLDSPRVNDLRALPMHGGPCVRLAEELTTATGEAALDALLRYHATVQRERRRGDGWIRAEAGTLRLVVTSYTARPEAVRFPSFKLDTVRSLLVDTGRLASDPSPTTDGGES